MLNTLLLGHYKLLKVIGQGGMGTVYLCVDINTNKQWAIKEILIKNRSKETILLEPNLLKKLDHPALNKIIDIFEEKDKIYIVMDYIEGRSLKEALISEKKFSEKTVISWAIQLCEVLIYLHNMEPYPIIYRDMKPGNILVDKDNKITLIDFGIASELLEEGMIDTQVAITRGYCAPEQYTDRTFDERTDIYSLGITLYHLLTGISPNDNTFELKPLRREDESLSREIDYIIGRAIRKNQEERYQCVEDLLYDFVNINKLNKDFKKIILKQVMVYFIFALLYVFFIGITYIGYDKIQNETSYLSESFIAQGNREIQENNYKSAIENFNKSVKLDEYNPDAYIGILNYYENTAKYKEGINYVNSNIDKFEKIPEIKKKYHYYLGNYQYRLKNYKEALSSYLEYNKVYTRNVDSLFMTTLTHIQLGDTKIYEKLFEELKTLKIDNARAYYIQAEVYRINKKFEFAVESYDKCIQLTEDKLLLVDAYISKASLYKDNPSYFKNSSDLQIFTLQECEKKLGTVKNINVLKMLVDAYNQKVTVVNDDDKKIYRLSVIKCYVDIISLGEDSIDTYINLAYMYRDVKNYESSEQTLKEAMLIYPDNFLSFYNLTVIQLEIELLKPEAARDFTNASINFEKTREIAIRQSKEKELAPLINTMKKLNIEL